VPTPPPGSLVRAHEVKPRGYVVRKGDTLASIARKLGCTSVQGLASANGIRPPRYALKPGQTLRVTDCAKH